MKYYQYNFISVLSKFSWQKSLVFLPAPFLAQIETVIYPLIALLLIIFADLFTALVAYFYTLKQEKKRQLKFNDYRHGLLSRGLRQTIKKGYQYGMAFIVVFIIEVFGFGGKVEFTIPLVEIDATLTQFVLWAFVLIEAKSIDENLKIVSGKSVIESITGIFEFLRESITRITGKKTLPDDSPSETTEEGEDTLAH
jgi:hypothetical protein